MGAPQGESAEIKSHKKRKVIRGESEETQDYVCGISREEAEELAFVPSALSEPRGSIYFCDNHCSEKKRSDTGSFRRWWLKKVEKPTQLICVSFDEEGASGPPTGQVNSAWPRMARWPAKGTGQGRDCLSNAAVWGCGSRVKTPGCKPMTGTPAHDRNGKAVVQEEILELRSTIQMFLCG